jgi:hypothetical protein
MWTFISYIIVFSMGWLSGAFMRGIAYDNQKWEALRWDHKLLAYRHVPMGAFLARGENILMGLRLNTDTFPAEGIKYEDS